MGNWTGGTLACNATCTGWDTSGCTSADDCGNGQIDTGEICDGANLGGNTCPDVGNFTGGTLACNGTCDGWDTSNCVNLTDCGNDQIDTGETCDGSDLGGKPYENQDGLSSEAVGVGNIGQQQGNADHCGAAESGDAADDDGTPVRHRNRPSAAECLDVLEVFLEAGHPTGGKAPVPSPGHHQLQVVPGGLELSVGRLADVHQHPMAPPFPVHCLSFAGDSAFVGLMSMERIEVLPRDLEDCSPHVVSAFGVHRRQSAVTVGDGEVQSPLGEMGDELELG